MASLSQISALAELLKPDQNEIPEKENLSSSSVFTPAQIGPPKKAAPNTSVKETSNDIWREEEVEECGPVDDDLDSRLAPRYEILFQQKVTTEDMFLGMSSRNPSTACCEDLTVKIHLPNTSYSDVQLNVTNAFLDCQTPKYKLGLYFPHQVDSKNGKAQWDADKNILTVTAQMIREYNCLNIDSR